MLNLCSRLYKLVVHPIIRCQSAVWIVTTGCVNVDNATLLGYRVVAIARMFDSCNRNSNRSSNSEYVSLHYATGTIQTRLYNRLQRVNITYVCRMGMIRLVRVIFWFMHTRQTRCRTRLMRHVSCINTYTHNEGSPLDSNELIGFCHG
jgi:hypothetical protein